MAEERIIKYYKRRWYILAVISIVSFSNNMAWLSYAAISSYAVDYYGSAIAPTVFNMLFMVCGPIGFLSMWTNAKYGLRFGCFVGAWLNLIGALLRLCASVDFAENLVGSAELMSTAWRFRVTLAGQILAASAQPFFNYLPAMLAAVWFPMHERVLANTIASLSSPLGSAAIYALAPHVINAARPRAFFLLNGIVTGGALIGALLSLGITSSHPPKAAKRKVALADKAGVEIEPLDDMAPNTPPTIDNFWRGVKIALTSRSFLILALSLGNGFGLFNALCNFLQPLLCAKGYTNTFAGAIGGGSIVAGLFASAFIGIFVGRTRLYEETIKACFCGAALAGCALMVLTRFRELEVPIAAAVLGFGAFGLSTYPIGLELGVEATFPVPESTSTGLITLTGQAFGVLHIFLTSFLKRPATAHELVVQTCTNTGTPIGVYDWKYSLMVWTICMVAICVIFSFTFWPTYHRMEYELSQKQAKLQRIQQHQHQQLDMEQESSNTPLSR